MRSHQTALVLILVSTALAFLLLVFPSTVHADACQSQQSGSWSNPGTWTSCNGHTPGQLANDTVTIKPGHDVTLDYDPNAIYSLVIEPGGMLNLQDSHLTFSAAAGNPGIVNYGTMDSGSGGGIIFNASYGNATASIVGTIEVTNVTISGVGVDFGTESTINGVLQMNPEGYIHLNPPIYAVDSTLRYSTGGSYILGNEWTSGPTGPGVPYHVEIIHDTDVSFGSITTPRTVRGNLSIGSPGPGGGTLTLSAQIGGDLEVKGSMGGNVLANNRLVSFTGSSVQEVGGTFDYFLVGLGSTVYANNVTINKDAIVNGVLTGSGGGLGGLVYFRGMNLTNNGTVSVGTFYINGPTTILFGSGSWNNSGLFIWGYDAPLGSTTVTLALDLTLDGAFVEVGDAVGTDVLDLAEHTLTLDGGSLTSSNWVGSITGTGEIHARGTTSLGGNFSVSSIFVDNGTSTIRATIHGDMVVASNATVLPQLLTFGNITVHGNLAGVSDTDYGYLQMAGLNSTLINQGAVTFVNVNFIGASCTGMGTGSWTDVYWGIGRGDLGSTTVTLANDITLHNSRVEIGDYDGTDILNIADHTLTLNSVETWLAPNGHIVGNSEVRVNGPSTIDVYGGSVQSPIFIDRGVVTGFGIIDALTVVNGATMKVEGGTSLSVSTALIQPGGILDITDRILYLGGAGTPLTNHGTLLTAGSTIAYSGTAPQTMVTAEVDYNNLTINNPQGVSLDGAEFIPGALTLTNGPLKVGNHNLTLGSSATWSRGSATGMVATDEDGLSAGDGFLCKEFANVGNFEFPVGDTFSAINYSPASITLNAGTFPGGTCVRVTDGVSPDKPSGTASHISRYWSASSTVAAPTYNASFVFRVDDLVGSGTMTGQKWDGGPTWQPLNATTGLSFNGVGLTTFSDFTAFSTPLAVTLASISALSQIDHITITWETASELDNLGFNLWRGTLPEDPAEQINSALIPSQAPGSSQGFTYTWQDIDVVPGQTYWYSLEDVDLNGATTLHGPVSATVDVPTAVAVGELRISNQVSNAWPGWVNTLVKVLQEFLTFAFSR